MEHEYENATKEAFEKLIESVSNSIQHATSSLVERQDAFELKSANRVDSLLKQISSLSYSLQQTSIAAETARTVPLPQPSTVACNICKNMFFQLSELDIHIKANHPNLHCDLCDKTLCSQPDFNVHCNRYHTNDEMIFPISTDHTQSYIC